MVELSALLYSQFIVYDRLTELINVSCAGSNASMAHIYIDMNSLMGPIFKNIGNVHIGEYNNITSCMINMAIHYRYFLRSRYSTNCKIFFIYSDNYPEYNRKWVAGYNDANYQTYHHSEQMNEILYNNLNIMKLMCQYLNGVYFIHTYQETGVMIQHLMHIMEEQETQPYMNFIITKDMYNYQLVYNPNTIILRPKKHYNQSKGTSDGDISYYIDRSNIWDVILSEKGNTFDKHILLCPELVSLVFAMSGIPQRGIKSVTPFKKVVESLLKLISELSLPNTYPGYIDNSIIQVYMNSSQARSKKKFTKDEAQNWPEIMQMINNFKAVDIPYQYTLFCETSPEFDSVRLSLVDLYDPEGLKKINEEYFASNPIDFMRL